MIQMQQKVPQIGVLNNDENSLARVQQNNNDLNNRI